MAISQGVGVSLATGVRTLPAAAAGRRCWRERTRASTSAAPATRSWSRSRGSRRCSCWRSLVVTLAERARVAVPALAARGRRGRRSARSSSPGRSPTTGYAAGPGLAAGAVCAALGFAAAQAFFDRAAARARTRWTRRRRPRSSSSSRRAPPWSSPALAVFVPPLSVDRLRLRRSGCCSYSGAGAGQKYEGLRILQVTKLVLVVVDALKPAMLERAVEEGKAPMFAEILRRGTYFPDCASVFPSVTPAASATITTGATVDRHGVPSIDWYHRGERRYVDYGSSGQAVRTFGVLRTITDTVYNMNFDHLSRAQPTFFERLDDAGVRTACTPFLIFRGRTRHELARAGLDAAGRARRELPARGLRARRSCSTASCTASREVDCRADARAARNARSLLGLRGRVPRAQRPLRLHAVLAAGQRSLLAPPRARPRPSRRSRAPTASRASSSRPAAESTQFFDDHAVILMADHSQIAVERPHPARRVRSADWRVLQPNDPDPEEAELAVCPGARSAMVYVLGARRCASSACAKRARAAA